MCLYIIRTVITDYGRTVRIYQRSYTTLCSVREYHKHNVVSLSHNVLGEKYRPSSVKIITIYYRTCIKIIIYLWTCSRLLKLLLF